MIPLDPCDPGARQGAAKRFKDLLPDLDLFAKFLADPRRKVKAGDLPEILEVSVKDQPVGFLSPEKEFEESQRLFIMKRNLEVIGDNDHYPFFVFVFVEHVMICELCELGERYTGNERVWAGGNEANLRLELAL